MSGTIVGPGGQLLTWPDPPSPPPEKHPLGDYTPGSYGAQLVEATLRALERGERIERPPARRPVYLANGRVLDPAKAVLREEVPPAGMDYEQWKEARERIRHLAACAKALPLKAAIAQLVADADPDPPDPFAKGWERKLRPGGEWRSRGSIVPPAERARLDRLNAKRKQRAAGRAALASLVAAVPAPRGGPFPRARKMTPLRPYRGGAGSVFVDLRDRRVLDRLGFPINGVEIGENGLLRRSTPALAAAAPIVEKEGTTMSSIARVAEAAMQAMGEAARAEAARATAVPAGEVGRLAHAIERLAERPLNVTVPAPVVNVEAQPPPVVNVQPPDVHVTVQAAPPTPPRAVRVAIDEDGTRWFVPEEDGPEAA